jgi:hypothetical protein
MSDSRIPRAPSSANATNATSDKTWATWLRATEVTAVVTELSGLTVIASAARIMFAAGANVRAALGGLGLGGPEFDGALLQRAGEEPGVVAQVDGFAGEHIPLGDATGERDGLEAEVDAGTRTRGFSTGWNRSAATAADRLNGTLIHGGEAVRNDGWTVVDD